MNLKVIGSLLTISALTGCVAPGYVQTNAVAIPVATPVYTTPVCVRPWYSPYRYWGHHHHRGRGRW